MDTTTVVLPGMTGRVDAYLNLILEDAGDDLPAPEPIAVDPITVEVIGSASPRSSRRWARRWSAPAIRPTSRSGATARPRCSTRDGNTLCQAEHIPMHLGSFIGIIPHPEAPRGRGDAAGRRVHRQRRL
jgi:hypothetical protein